jgi:hypothetical protein
MTRSRRAVNNPRREQASVDETLVQKIYTAAKEGVLAASTDDNGVCLLRTNETINALLIMLAEMGVQMGVTDSPREARQFVKELSTILKVNLTLVHDSGIKQPFVVGIVASRDASMH